MKIYWWSAGITSAVSCKMALDLYGDGELFYIDTGAAHPDNIRFLNDCEKWYGKKINTVKNSKGFVDHIDVIRKTRYVNGPGGARCTGELKKNVRYELQEKYKISNQVFGFEYEKSQVNRAIRFLQQYPEAKGLMPLIEKGLTKDNCAAILKSVGIDLPIMYLKGYGNNNCLGCVKGGKGYWNKIRIDFPDWFDKMSEAEREVGHSCIKGQFLDELDPLEGRPQKKIVPECGVFCEVEFSNIPDKNLEAVMDKRMSVYEAAI